MFGKIKHLEAFRGTAGKTYGAPVDYKDPCNFPKSFYFIMHFIY